MPKKPYPPFILLFGLVFNIGFGLFGWPDGLAFTRTSILFWLGASLILLGMMAGVSVSKQFRAHKTSIVPDHKPDSMIKDGLFAYSRNPIYLSMVLMLLGAALLSGNGLGFLVALAFTLWINWRWIPLEEKNMRTEFGEEFDLYCQNVRRWI